MKASWWEELEPNWKELLVRNWVLFKKYKGSIKEYLWDEFGAYDYFLCRNMGLPYNDFDEDITISEMVIKNHLRAVDDFIIAQIIDMEFIAMDASISNLTPLSHFNNVKILDFHCNNTSDITDFSPLKKFEDVSIFDYADYQLVDFDKTSNIKQFPKIHYIKCYGMPEKEINSILKGLNDYNI